MKLGEITVIYIAKCILFDQSFPTFQYRKMIRHTLKILQHLLH